MPMNEQNGRAIYFFIRILFAFVLLVLPTLAQQSQSQDPQSAPPDPPPSSSIADPGKKTTDAPGPKGKDVKDKEVEKNSNATSNDRLFFTLPNFLTLENARQVPPLTTGQKFNVVARSSFDYVQYPWYGFLAGISQAEDSERGYGQGAQGYGKRYGAAWADGTIENFVTSAVLPSLLRQDPRFFQSGHGGFWHRSWYAFSRIFVTRGDSGKEQFNFSEVFGSAIAAGVSTYSYHPHEDKTLSNTAKVWGTQVGYDSLTYVVKEFWPDIRRKVFHKNRPE